LTTITTAISTNKEDNGNSKYLRSQNMMKIKMKPKIS